MRGEVFAFGPIPGAAEQGPTRSRIGTSRLPWWSRRVIGLLLLALVVLPWLPIAGPTSDARPAGRVRGVGHGAILDFAFAPDNETIATIQMDGRVALRERRGRWERPSFLDYRGFALALAFSPDGRSLAVGGSEPDIRLYDLGDRRGGPSPGDAERVWQGPGLLPRRPPPGRVELPP